MFFARLHSVYWSLVIFIAFNLFLFINNDQSGFTYVLNEEEFEFDYVVFSLFILFFLVVVNYGFYVFRNVNEGLKWYHYLSSVFNTILVVFTFFMIFFWPGVITNFIIPNGSRGHLGLAMEFLFVSLWFLSLANFSDIIRLMKEKM